MQSRCSGGKVTRLRVPGHKRGRALFRHHLVALREHDSDALRTEEAQEWLVEFHVGAGGIAKGVPAALVTLAEELPQRCCVARRGAKFRADPLVHHFRVRFGQLCTKAMEQEIVREPAVGVKLLREVRRFLAHRDNLDAKNIERSGKLMPKEI